MTQNTQRQDSAFSTESGLKDSDVGGPDLDLEPTLLDANGISRIFIDAVQYGEVISEQTKGKKVDEDGVGEGGERLRKESDADSVRRLAELIGRDLSTPELAASERFAKFSVLDQEDAFNSVDTSEVEEGDSESGESETASEKESERPSEDTESKTDRTDVSVPISASNLSPEQIVELLIDEFGPLTVGENDTERLVWEQDGAYFQEIVILGMVHLTTHRLSFHASLLSTRPDLLPERQIIRQGPVTIHREGLRRKRRVWLELSHDMLTSFPSSKAEDRVRPLQSILRE